MGRFVPRAGQRSREGAWPVEGPRLLLSLRPGCQGDQQKRVLVGRAMPHPGALRPWGSSRPPPARGRHPGSERRGRNEAEPVGPVASPPLTLIPGPWHAPPPRCGPTPTALDAWVLTRRWPKGGDVGGDSVSGTSCGLLAVDCWLDRPEGQPLPGQGRNRLGAE